LISFSVFSRDQMDTRCRWGYVCHNRKLSAGTRMAVQEAVEYACSRRFADSGGDSGYGIVCVMGDVHSLTVDESSMSGKLHDCQICISRVRQYFR